MVRVTSIKHICDMKHLVPHSPFGSSNVFSAVIPSN